MPKVNYFLQLGIPLTSTASDVDAAFERLANNLKASNFSNSPKALEQASCALARIREAHTALKDDTFRAAHSSEFLNQPEPFSPEQLKPFLGHVCVAAGIISYQDLMDAVSKQIDVDLPLGQILQERRLISQTELEGMLMGQKLYGAPLRPLEAMVKTLLALQMVNLDMVKIASIDQRTSMAPLDELLCKRGWIEKPVLDALK